MVVFLFCYRTQLAVLHYNENADRAQVEKEGEKQYRLKPSKLKKTWQVVPLKENTTYGMSLVSYRARYAAVQRYMTVLGLPLIPCSVYTSNK